MKKSTVLKEAISKRDALVCVGVHDVISAKLADSLGFKAVQVSGFGLSATYLGLPDMAFLTASQMLEFTQNIVDAVDIPVMADIDTGFGNAINARYITGKVINAGVAGMNIEDQVFPKRCGHLDGKQVVSKEEMVLKIKACAEVRDEMDPDFVINARTDAILKEGVDSAIERGNAYAQAGADMIFVESPSSVEDIEKVVKGIDAPVSINLFDNVAGGKTPLIPVERLREIGVARVSIPVGTTFAAVRGIKNYLEAISDGALAEGRFDLVASFDEFKELVGFNDFRKKEKDYLVNFVE
ncbi:MULTISPECIES: isocitrate lyase/PEP mutase family protein [Dethiosulfovibrio]|uniref:Oxaloacetate decarboxylase n=2 Tax=Dethiosulfovibrio TaxID=47054 RepID=A0ABS9EM54_9BACT|nr:MULTISPECIES: oxaloacetate decarboxylase [Dethiosulfovibrio]MCF4113221.1 oxaloacetate decarboxylase [Dethiosulfovibrio russensis]MCF4142285.1 oxaloacetate decarboxylase [Dethiosulfovibrio marinus]MCF4144593.1 oxaloacetate decarboxylase [Dethiosulfovibrio acidaminovorans]